MSGRANAFNLVRAATQAAGLGQRTDAELLAAFLDGRDPAAFEALVRRHGPLVLSACRQILRDEAAADDAFQATFVALYQQAGSIRDRPSLAGWLFRVARRAATSARRAEYRRARRESANVGRATTLEPIDLSWREACVILHGELDRLPNAYRLPLILCYLQGLSRDEAARRLGWSLNELRGQLERGRIRLRTRLQKRGVTLSAGLLTAVASGLPGGLVASTLGVARRSVPPVLSQSVWKAGSVAALAATVVVAVAIQLHDLRAQPPANPAGSTLPVTKGPDAPKPVVTGRVLDPDGKAVAGAEVFARPPDAKEKPRMAVRTDAAGRFSLAAPSPAPDSTITLTATADRFAAGWATWDGTSTDDLAIVLAKDDLPIRGRVLDLEGKPVAGVSVRVAGTSALPDGGSKAYLEWLAGRRGHPLLNTITGAPPGATAEARTDADGRFEIRGIGRDRVARLLVTGSTIAHEYAHVVTVPALDPQPAQRSGRAFPASFDLLSAPSRPIRGTVRDADTGKPVAGVKLNGFNGPTDVLTDKDGRYELPGYKKGPRYIVYAWPQDGSTYFPGMAEAADPAGLDPVPIDLTVRAGVQVTGRVRDTATGKPVAAIVRYFALAGNPHITSLSVGEKPGEFFTLSVKARADGTFTCAALPGRGILTVTADSTHYPSARVDPKALREEEGGPAHNTDQLWIGVGGAGITSLSQDGYQAIVLLNVDKAKPPAEQRIELTPAEPVRGRLLDTDGKPLLGVKVRGLNQSGDDWSAPLRSAEFTASPPHPDRPRRLTFRHDGRKLVGTAVVAAGSARPVDFKLEPWAALTGRLLDDEGRPIARVTIYASAASGADGKTVDTTRIGSVFTDLGGRFRIDGLFPGIAYDLRYRELKPNGRTGPVSKGTMLKPGEERDLGDLKVPRKE